MTREGVEDRVRGRRRNPSVAVVARVSVDYTHMSHASETLKLSQ